MASDHSEGVWHRRVTTLVGQRIKHLRETSDPKITVRELADKCEDLGYRIEAQVIHNMEVKRRDVVSVAELLVLAAALEVPLALLLTPLGSGEQVELLPGRSTDPPAAYQWLIGRLPASELARPPQLDVTWFKHRVIVAYENHDTGLRRYLHWGGGDRALLVIAGARIEMQRNDWWRPPLPHQVVKALRPILRALGWYEPTPGELVPVPAGVDFDDLEDLDDPADRAP